MVSSAMAQRRRMQSRARIENNAQSQQRIDQSREPTKSAFTIPPFLYQALAGFCSPALYSILTWSCFAAGFLASVALILFYAVPVAEQFTCRAIHSSSAAPYIIHKILGPTFCPTPLSPANLAPALPTPPRDLIRTLKEGTFPNTVTMHIERIKMADIAHILGAMKTQDFSDVTDLFNSYDEAARVAIKNVGKLSATHKVTLLTMRHILKGLRDLLLVATSAKFTDVLDGTVEDITRQYLVLADKLLPLMAQAKETENSLDRCDAILMQLKRTTAGHTQDTLDEQVALGADRGFLGWIKTVDARSAVLQEQLHRSHDSLLQLTTLASVAQESISSISVAVTQYNSELEMHRKGMRHVGITPLPLEQQLQTMDALLKELDPKKEDDDDDGDAPPSIYLDRDGAYSPYSRMITPRKQITPIL